MGLIAFEGLLRTRQIFIPVLFRILIAVIILSHKEYHGIEGICEHPFKAVNICVSHGLLIYFSGCTEHLSILIKPPVPVSYTCPPSQPSHLSLTSLFTGKVSFGNLIKAISVILLWSVDINIYHSLYLKT